MDKEHTEKLAATRRNFLKLSASGGFTAAMVAGAMGTLWSSEAAAQTQSEERDREASAETIMTLATAYVLTADRSYPLMQLDLKENIQNTSNGRIYVKLAAGGQLGTEGALVQSVQGGTIQAAQHSISNFAPFAPVIDLINLPYFCGTNQRFENLVASEDWQAEVNPRIEASGFKALTYINIDPRVVAVREGANPVLTPADLSGVKFRVPGSEMLQQYYRLVGANPTPIAWGETPSAIKQGVADALDPSVGALYVFGFSDMLSHVTFTRAVPDSQIYSMNLEWFNSLAGDVQEALMFAGQITRQQNLAKVPAARNFAMSELRKAGVEFHSLSEEQLAEWVEAGGYQRPEWDSYKENLAGSMETFAKLEEAASTQSRFYVHDE